MKRGRIHEVCIVLCALCGASEVLRARKDPGAATGTRIALSLGWRWFARRGWACPKHEPEPQEQRRLPFKGVALIAGQGGKS